MHVHCKSKKRFLFFLTLEIAFSIWKDASKFPFSIRNRRISSTSWFIGCLYFLYFLTSISLFRRSFNHFVIKYCVYFTLCTFCLYNIVATSCYLCGFSSSIFHNFVNSYIYSIEFLTTFSVYHFHFCLLSIQMK